MIVRGVHSVFEVLDSTIQDRLKLAAKTRDNESTTPKIIELCGLIMTRILLVGSHASRKVGDSVTNSF